MARVDSRAPGTAGRVGEPAPLSVITRSILVHAPTRAGQAVLPVGLGLWLGLGRSSAATAICTRMAAERDLVGQLRPGSRRASGGHHREDRQPRRLSFSTTVLLSCTAVA